MTDIVHDVVQKCYSDFELQGVSETVLKSKIYQTINSRLQVTTVVIYVAFTALSLMKFCMNCIN